MNLVRYLDKTPRMSSDAYVMQGTYLIGDVLVKKHAGIWFGAVLRGDIAPIVIGEETNIQDNSVVHVDFDMPTIVGDRVTVGHGAILHGCIIEDECLIGMGATVLSGAVVEKGSMVGAGALVPPGMRIPAGSLAVGLPAKILRQLSPEEQEKIRESAKHYLEFARNYELYQTR